MYSLLIEKNIYIQCKKDYLTIFQCVKNLTRTMTMTYSPKNEGAVRPIIDLSNHRIVLVLKHNHNYYVIVISLPTNKIHSQYAT